MPISAAAMMGIEYFGHRWRAEISLAGQPKRLADPDSLKVGDCAAIRDAIVARLKAWLQYPSTARALGESSMEDMAEAIGSFAEAADDPDDLKAAMEALYDEFDYHRVCVVA